MRIDPTGTGQVAAGGVRRRRPSPFALPAEDEDERGGAVEAMGQPDGAAAVVAPSGPPPTPQQPAPLPADRQAATQYGRAVLDALAGLQAAVLGGAGAGPRERLTELVRGLPRAAEPSLDAVLQAIAQRAAVELARSE
jgi:hypothetical protein